MPNPVAMASFPHPQPYQGPNNRDDERYFAFEQSPYACSPHTRAGRGQAPFRQVEPLTGRSPSVRHACHRMQLMYPAHLLLELWGCSTASAARLLRALAIGEWLIPRNRGEDVLVVTEDKPGPLRICAEGGYAMLV
jgi:hypothetical protein